MAYSENPKMDASIRARMKQIYNERIKDNRYTGSAFVGGARMLSMSKRKKLHNAGGAAMNMKKMAGAGSGRGKRLKKKGPMAGYHPHTRGSSFVGGRTEVAQLRKMVKGKLKERLKERVRGAAIVPGGAGSMAGAMHMMGGEYSVMGGADNACGGRRHRTYRRRVKTRARPKHSGSAFVGGRGRGPRVIMGGKKRKPSAWNMFFKNYMKQHPGMEAKAAMKAAAKAYKKR